MKKFENRLNEIINDMQSGSVALLQKLIDLFLDEFGGNMDIDPNLIANIKQIESSLGHFAVVKHFIDELNICMDKTTGNKMDNELLKNFIRKYDARWKNVIQKIASIALKNIQFQGRRILLHSNSSGIKSLFELMAKSKIDVSIIQTESRPENEGIIQAKALADMGFKVSLIVDSAAGLLMPQVDMVIVGADQVHPHYFVNKIGTQAIALLAAKNNVPCYVLADSRKFDKDPGDKTKLMELSKPGDDVWKNLDENINSVNYYFEAIPCLLIEKFITEKGIFKTTEFNDL